MTAVLDLIDAALADHETGPDAMRHAPDAMPPARPDGRIPFHDLMPHAQERLQAWVREHKLDPCNVPVEAVFDFDPATREWRIEVLRLIDGKMKLVDDEISTRIVRRVQLSPLPWPTAVEVAR